MRNEGWTELAGLLRRLARGDGDAVRALERLEGRDDVPVEVADAAENLGLLLVKLEGREFLLTAADEARARLHQLNELKNRHLGIAAHDLRNPLGTIRGLAKLLTREDLADEKRRAFSASIVAISEEMLTLVENLLDVAVIESGRLDLDLVRGNLAHLSEERGRRAAASGARKSIRVETRTTPVPDTLFDPSRMGQVLDNLLSNAVKFSPPGSRVELACEHDGERVVLTVSDEGAGIPAAELSGIFDPYSRSTARPTGGEKSTGLGLSIVKPIVDAHGGSVDVASDLGEGTTFTIRMPVRPESAPESREAS